MTLISALSSVNSIQFNSIEYIFPNFVYLKKDGNEMGDSTWDSVFSLNVTTNE